MSHLTLGLSKRLSTPNSSQSQKRRSMSLNVSGGPGSAGAPPTNSNSGSRPGSGSGSRGARASVAAGTVPDTPSSDLTSEDGNVRSRPASPGIQSLRNTVMEQKTEIERLNAEIVDLREELYVRPTEEELESVRKEWETSEDLFAQSQKDNEQKHATIEHLRQYIKVLEHKLEEMLGDGWRDCCHNLPAMTPIHSGASFASTTPLPRPGSLNLGRSSSASKRASRSSHRHSGSFEASRLRELRDLGSEKTTPTSALRKLEGITETPKDDNVSTLSTRSTSSDVDCLEVDGLMDVSATSAVSSATPFNASPPLKRTSGSQRSSRSPSPSTPAQRVAHSDRDKAAAAAERERANALADQVAQLAGLIKALPSSIVTQISNDDERAAERARIEEQKAAMLEMLDAAEQRADAREIRLQSMLAEAKACSGQMGW